MFGALRVPVLPPFRHNLHGAPAGRGSGGRRRRRHRHPNWRRGVVMAPAAVAAVLLMRRRLFRVGVLKKKEKRKGVRERLKRE
jgi:hypothetical protein